MGGGGVVGFGLVCQVGPSLGSERGVFGPVGGPIFMQTFALTLFRTVGSAVLYQNAIFAGFFDSLIDHEQLSGCCALPNVHVPVLLQAATGQKWLNSVSAKVCMKVCISPGSKKPVFLPGDIHT